LNITPNYLNIIVKETIGTTANNLMHERIILEAKRLLIQKNSDITQIAYDLGFKDASYFARFFKRFTGQSPSDFRSEIYKKYLNQNN
jgi:AraC family transcriptional activator of pobA